MEQLKSKWEVPKLEEMKLNTKTEAGTGLTSDAGGSGIS